MPSNNFQSPFQANTVPPPRRTRDSILETALARMTLRSFARTAIPQANSHVVSGAAQGGSMAANNRANTSRYTLGDNTRSYLEGMKPISRIRGQQSSGNITSRAGSARGSIFNSQHDVEMASRQEQIESMAPTERRAQETWAQSIVQRTASCPQKYEWDRISGGYKCKGGHHYIPDRLIAEGNGGLLLLPNTSEIYPNYGPYYPDPNCDGQFLYTGSEPRPRAAPEFINEMGNSNSSGTRRYRSSRSVNSISSISQFVKSHTRGSQSGGSQFGGSYTGGLQPQASHYQGSRYVGSQYGELQPHGSHYQGSQYGGSQYGTSHVPGFSQGPSQYSASQLARIIGSGGHAGLGVSRQGGSRFSLQP